MADHPHTIDRWDDATGWPGRKITLRNRARVIEQSWQD